MADTKELRADAPADLVRALDALALAHDLNRTTYMVQVLERHVALEIHRLNLLNSMLKGNPLLAELGRSTGV